MVCAESISERKKELPLDEVKRQIDALKAFAVKESNAVLISSDTSIAETKDTVLQLLLTHLKKINAQD